MFLHSQAANAHKKVSIDFFTNQAQQPAYNAIDRLYF